LALLIQRGNLARKARAGQHQQEIAKGPHQPKPKARILVYHGFPLSFNQIGGSYHKAAENGVLHVLVSENSPGLLFTLVHPTACLVYTYGKFMATLPLR